MVNLIIQLIIALLIAGFVLFCWQKLKAVVAQFVVEPFLSLIDVLIYILIGAIILFWAVIPLLRSLGAMIHL